MWKCQNVWTDTTNEKRSDKKMLKEINWLIKKYSRIFESDKKQKTNESRDIEIIQKQENKHNVKNKKP